MYLRILTETGIIGFLVFSLIILQFFCGVIIILSLIIHLLHL